MDGVKRVWHFAWVMGSPKASSVDIENGKVAPVTGHASNTF
jgi:hypothetical protein